MVRERARLKQTELSMLLFMVPRSVSDPYGEPLLRFRRECFANLYEGNLIVAGLLVSLLASDASTIPGSTPHDSLVLSPIALHLCSSYVELLIMRRIVSSFFNGLV